MIFKSETETASLVSERPSALIEVKQLYGVAIQGLDGEIGRGDELLFDDEFWTVRYLIVNIWSHSLERISPIVSKAQRIKGRFVSEYSTAASRVSPIPHRT